MQQFELKKKKNYKVSKDFSRGTRIWENAGEKKFPVKGTKNGDNKHINVVYEIIIEF